MTAPPAADEGLPTDEQLARETRRTVGAAGAAVVVLLALLLLDVAGAAELPTATLLLGAAVVLLLAALVPTGPARRRVREVRGRGVLVAGSRRRRRRLRRAVLLTRTAQLDDAEARIALSWARVARVRVHAELSTLPFSGLFFGVGYSAALLNGGPTTGWLFVATSLALVGMAALLLVLVREWWAIRGILASATHEGSR